MFPSERKLRQFIISEQERRHEAINHTFGPLTTSAERQARR
jgi:hypothetical protein